MQGLITLEVAIPFIMGSNIGTCITALIAGIGSSKTGKRVALGHLFFNVSGVIIFYLFLKQFIYLSAQTSTLIPRQIANAHTIFNIANTLILLPFIPYVLSMLNRIISGEDEVVKKGTIYLDQNLIDTPSIALGQVTKELIRMGNIAQNMLETILESILRNSPAMLKDVYLKEDILNTIHREITRHLILISQKELSSNQSKRMTNLMNISNHIERTGDHIENIADLTETKINEKLSFSQKAENDLKFIFDKVEQSLNYAITGLKTQNPGLSKHVLDKENEIDLIEEKLRNEHISRLKKQICNPEAGIIYIDILSNLERIGDHAYDISLMVIDELNKTNLKQ